MTLSRGTERLGVDLLEAVHFTRHAGPAIVCRMDGSVTPHKGAIEPRQGALAARIGPKVRAAIKLRVEEGITILEACRRAGLSEAGWYKAMQRSAVLAHYEQAELQFVQTVERRRKGYRARAIEVAAELMERGSSEAVRMRAVEFFAGETKQPLVNVSIGQSQEPATGYRYKRPGDAATDRTSEAEDAQVIDMQAQSPDVGK